MARGRAGRGGKNELWPRGPGGCIGKATLEEYAQETGDSLH